MASKPRMADFAKIAAAVDAILGTSGLARYMNRGAELAADGLSGDSFAVQMQDVITAEDPFEGTSAQLLELLRPPGDGRPPRDWPKDARAATGRLHRLAPAFRKLGWTFADMGRGGHGKQLRFRIFSPVLRCPVTMPAHARNARRMTTGRALRATAGKIPGLLTTTGKRKSRPHARATAPNGVRTRNAPTARHSRRPSSDPPPRSHVPMLRDASRIGLLGPCGSRHAWNASAVQDVIVTLWGQQGLSQYQTALRARQLATRRTRKTA